MEATTARLRRIELSPTRFLQLTLVSLGALWLIVVTGAAVRVTDSGLGCRHWPVVAAHLLLSMALLAGAVVLALEALALRSGRAEPVAPLELRRGALLVTAAAGVLLVTGALATAGGPHSGGGAEHVDRLWRLQPLIYVHAASVAIFGLGLVFVLGYLASQRQRWPRLFTIGCVVFGVLLAQMALGEVQYRTHLPWPLVLVHVGLAGAVWALLVVAPPMRRGSVKPSRFISPATWAISSRDGVMRPLRPIMSAPVSRAVLRMRS